MQQTEKIIRKNKYFIPHDKKDLKKVLRIFRNNKWVVDENRIHYVIYPPSTSLKRIVISKSPSDYRWSKEFLQDVRNHPECPFEFKRNIKE